MTTKIYWQGKNRVRSYKCFLFILQSMLQVIFRTGAVGKSQTSLAHILNSKCNVTSPDCPCIAQCWPLSRLHMFRPQPSCLLSVFPSHGNCWRSNCINIADPHNFILLVTSLLLWWMTQSLFSVHNEFFIIPWQTVPPMFKFAHFSVFSLSLLTASFHWV